MIGVLTRKGLTGTINEVIKELWPDGSVTRESLGILAKARAMLYFNGHVYPVSFDTKEEGVYPSKLGSLSRDSLLPI